MINFEEFVDLMSNFSAEDSFSDIQKIFKLYDADNKGFINAGDIERVSEIVGEVMTADEIE